MCSEARRYAALSAAAWMVSLLVVSMQHSKKLAAAICMQLLGSDLVSGRKPACSFDMRQERACVRV